MFKLNLRAQCGKWIEGAAFVDVGPEARSPTLGLLVYPPWSQRKSDGTPRSPWASCKDAAEAQALPVQGRSLRYS